MAAGLSARTAARRLSCLRQFHRFLLREGVRADDPTQTMDSPQPAAAAAEIPERAGACRAAGCRGRRARARTGLVAVAALELLYATGLRVSELLSLRRTALATGAAMLAVRGKGGRERLVPLGGAAREAASRP